VEAREKIALATKLAREKRNMRGTRYFDLKLRLKEETKPLTSGLSQSPNRNAEETFVGTDLSELPLDLLQKVDIYSLGMVLWQIATRKAVHKPMWMMDPSQYFVLEGGFVPKTYEELVRKCLGAAHDRPKVEEIVASLQSLLIEVR
jgi:hypothetical protein